MVLLEVIEDASTRAHRVRVGIISNLQVALKVTPTSLLPSPVRLLDQGRFRRRQ